MGEIRKFPIQKTRAQRKSIVRHEEKVDPVRERERVERMKNQRTKHRRETREDKRFNKQFQKYKD